MIKILEQIDIQPILDFYTSVENDITWGEDYVSKGKQTGIQYKENTDPWLSAVGRSKGDELSHDQLNPFYKGTIIESLINQFNLKRTRLLWLNSWSELVKLAIIKTFLRIAHDNHPSPLESPIKNSE